MTPPARHVALALSVLATTSWAPLDARRQAPVFRGGVDLITVDVRVLDRQGRPIRGLRPEEFQVELDGQQRPVQAIEYVEFGDARTSAPVTPPAAGSLFQPRTSTEEGRSILVAFDDLSFQPLQGRSLVEDVGRWLSKLDPRDRVGVGTTSGGGPPLTWSTDREMTLRAIRGLAGRRDRILPASLRAVVTIEEARSLRDCELLIDGAGNPQLEGCGEGPKDVLDRECDDVDDSRGCAYAMLEEATRVRTDANRDVVFQTGGLADILSALAAAPSPRVLVLISRGVPVENPTELAIIARVAASGGISVFVLAAPGYASDSELPSKASSVGLMPTDAHRQDNALRQAGIESVAGATGGQSHVVVGSADAFLDRTLVETSGYYRLGVEPLGGSRDWMALKVSTRRSGASVRVPTRIARPGAAPEVGVSAPETIDQRLSRALRQGGILRGMFVELATSLSRDPTGQQLQIAANVRLREERPGPLQAMFALVAAGGVIVISGRLTLVERHAGPGFRAAFHVPVLPGRYQLRIAVADARGDVGAAEREVSARLKRVGSYYTGDLVVAWAGADQQLQYPELDEVPATAVVLRPMLELYAADGKPTTIPRARLVVEPSAGGSPVREQDLETVVGGTVARVRGELSASSLPPGEYVVHAVIFEGTTETGRVSTTLRIARPTQAAPSVGPPQAGARPVGPASAN